MCGRYVAPGEADMERDFGFIPLHAPNPFRDVYNVAPTARVPVIRSREGQVELLGMRWGLIPFFAHGDPGPYSTINARVETMRTSPAYRNAWKRGQRCLIVARGFYEWQVIPGGKQPWYIGCADQPIFGFAGLWDSSTPEGGEAILSCTIITLPASPMMAEIHNTKHREPAIIKHEDRSAWLQGTADDAFACLRSYSDELRSAWPVSRAVNTPKNNDPELMEPVTAAALSDHVRPHW